ncbi:hypothetical protein JCM3774_004643 [Rhodotorula dairenensis]
MATPDPSLVLQDLLSPPCDDLAPRVLAQQLVLQLSTVPLERPHLAFISLLTRYAASSGALWDSPALSRWDRCMLAYEALRQSVALRLNAIARPATASPRTRQSEDTKSNSGWSARRSLKTFLDQVCTGLWADPTRTSDDPAGRFGTVDPLIRLAMASGILAALQEWKRTKERLWVGGSSALPRAEREAGHAWRDYLAQTPLLDEVGSAAWLAAQTMPFVRIEDIAQSWPAPALVDFLTGACASAFADGQAFSQPSLAADLTHTSNGLLWPKESASYSAINALITAPIFVSLGSVSRALGRSLEAAAVQAGSSDRTVSNPALPAIHRFSTLLLATTSRLAEGWAATAWADVEGESGLAPETREATAPWTILKTMLFAQTLIYSSLLEVVSMRSSSQNGPTTVQRNLATEAVRALSKTYFVALKFGQAGFPAWRAVLAGLIDVVTVPQPSPSRPSCNVRSAGEELVRSLEMPRGAAAAGDGRHRRAIDRAGVTFWVNTAEQVMAQLGDDYVEKEVLHRCRPYLEDATYRDTFEAAHSVILAVFATNKRCTCDVAPWYLTLVLRTFPDLLTVTQLRLAYATTVAAVSKTDGALAWWCIEELIERIESLPISIGLEPSTCSKEGNASAPLEKASAPGSLGQRSSPAPSKEESQFVTPMDARVSTLPRGPYLLALAALLPSVSLVLLPPLLSHLERLVRLEPVESDGRAAVVEAVFEQVGMGMDAVKRKDATEWWLLHGADLRNGGPLPDGLSDNETEAAHTGADAEHVSAPAQHAAQMTETVPHHLLGEGLVSGCLGSPHLALRKIDAIKKALKCMSGTVMASGSGKSTAPAAHRIFPHRRADEAPQFEDVARLIKDGKAKRVMIMAGAGISTSAGIPDFRSPGTGLYDNLAQYDLPYAEAIFDIDYLEEHPEAFYTLAKELYPGNFKPTTSHYFFRLLQDKGILHGLWSQNIDTLERLAGVEEDRLVEAHGSFATAKCLRCGKRYDKDDIKPQVMRGEVVRCQQQSCKGRRDALIKPEIVFFGEGLPDKFFSRMKDFSSCDLLIVVGTSLTVGPFNSLMHRVPSSCPRLLINLESVGEIEHAGSSIGFDFEGQSGKPIRDVRKLAKADEAFEELCELLGWADELRGVREEGWRTLAGAVTPSEQQQKKDQETPEERQKEVLSAVDAALKPKTAEPKEDRDVDDLAEAVSKVELQEPVAPAAKGETPEEASTTDRPELASPRKAPL